MDTEKMTVKSEYSRLNNVSSGDEVEQFALPIHTAGLQDRPKRRRKRKDFDSLKGRAQDLVTTARGSSICSCFNCFAVVCFTVLAASVCGLAIMCYTLTRSVGDMQTQIDNLQTVKTTLANDIMQIRSKDDKLIEKYTNLETQLTNFTRHLASINETVGKLTSRVSDTQSLIESLKKNPGVDQQQQIAQFGSEIETLKGEVATLKEKELTDAATISAVDQRLTMMETALQREQVTHNPTSPGNPEAMVSALNALQHQISSVNETCISKTGILNDLLLKVDSTVTANKQRVASNIGEIQHTLTDLQSSLEEIRASVNETLSNSPVASAQLHGEEEEEEEEGGLTDRVDQLEAYVREVSSKLDDKIVALTESQVANLSISTGIEQIMQQAFDAKFSDLKDVTDRLSSEVGMFSAHLVQLEDHQKALTEQLFSLHTNQPHTGADTKTPSTTASATEPHITTAGNRATVKTTTIVGNEFDLLESDGHVSDTEFTSIPTTTEDNEELPNMF